MDVAVGRRIRDLRRTRQLSLEAVAARTDLSIGFLSQIERGLSSPSLRVLATLADVLGVGIAALFGASPSADSASDHVVTRRLQRPELKLWRTGISKQLLSPAGAENRLNANYIASGDIGSAKVVSLHTDKDGLVIVENENFYASVVSPSNLTTAIAVETTPTHCGFTAAETVAGWESLRAWVAGGQQPTAQDIQNTCDFLVANSLAPGPCRIDPNFVIPPLSNRIRPR